MKYILGIDQGGTKTHAIVVNEALAIRGFASAPGGCYASDGLDRAMGNIDLAARSAIQQAGIGVDQIACLCSGMTGADWPHEYRLLEDSLRALMPGPRVKVVNDCIIGMRAGTKSRFGAVAAAGTGYNCAVIHPAGEEVIFGYYVSEGDSGGSAIGRRALQAVMDADCAMGGPTALTERVLGAYGYPTVEALMIDYFAGRASIQVKDLTPMVFSASAEGDAVAGAILEDMGRRFAKYAAVGMERLHMADMAFDLVLNGSVFKDGGSRLIDAFRKAVHAANPKVRLINAGMEPVLGAAIIALEMLLGPQERIFEMMKKNAFAHMGNRVTGGGDF